MYVIAKNPEILEGDEAISTPPYITIYYLGIFW